MERRRSPLQRCSHGRQLRLRARSILFLDCITHARQSHRSIPGKFARRKNAVPVPWPVRQAFRNQQCALGRAQRPIQLGRIRRGRSAFRATCR